MGNTISNRPPASHAAATKPYGVRDVPEALTRGAEQGELKLVTAKKGDSLWKIWKASGRPCAWKDFMALNQHLGEKLFPGDSVAVPSRPNAQPQPEGHWGAHDTGGDVAARTSSRGDVYEAAPAGKAVSSGTGGPVRADNGTPIRTAPEPSERPAPAATERERTRPVAQRDDMGDDVRADVVRSASGTAVRTENGAVRTKPVDGERYGRQ